MVEFGFIEDDTMTYESTWAGHEPATPTLPPGVVSSEDPNYWMVGGPPESGGVEPALVPVPLDDRVYVAGHRVDHLDLDDNGFVKDNTFDPGFSGQEYLNQKLEAKGFKAPCCGSCAEGEGRGCDEGCGTTSSKTPPALANGPRTTAVPVPDIKTLPSPVSDGDIPLGTCCCCVENMRVVASDEKTGRGTYWDPARYFRRYKVEVDCSVVGVGDLDPCTWEWWEWSKEKEVAHYEDWKPGEWNNALATWIGKLHVKESERRQRQQCQKDEEGRKKEDGKCLLKMVDDPRPKFGATRDAWLWFKACSCGDPERCNLQCCCVGVRLETDWIPSLGPPLTTEIWPTLHPIATFVGPYCGKAPRCVRPSITDLQEQTAERSTKRPLPHLGNPYILMGAVRPDLHRKPKEKSWKKGQGK